MKQTKVKASSGERTVTTKDVLAKPTIPLTVPARDVDTMESIVCGFRMSVVSATDGDGKEIGGVDSGGGLGSPWIHVHWKGKWCVINAKDLLREHVARVAPEDLRMFDKKLG